jgi:hypothetical protein
MCDPEALTRVTLEPLIPCGPELHAGTLKNPHPLDAAVFTLQAADAIKAMLSPTAVVVRGGQRSTVDASTLVPGVQLINPACGHADVASKLNPACMSRHAAKPCLPACLCVVGMHVSL